MKMKTLTQYLPLLLTVSIVFAGCGRRGSTSASDTASQGAASAAASSETASSAENGESGESAAFNESEPLDATVSFIADPSLPEAPADDSLPEYLRGEFTDSIPMPEIPDSMPADAPIPQTQPMDGSEELPPAAQGTIGETISVTGQSGSYEITIDSIRSEASPDGSVTVTAAYTCRNIDIASGLAVGSFSFRMADAAKTWYPPVLPDDTSSAPLPDPILPDQTVSGTCSFQTPKDVSGLSLVYDDLILGTKSAWAFAVP